MMSEELKLDRYEVTEGGGTFKCPGGEMVYYSDVKSFIADNNAALRAELATLKARQGEAVAYVSEESFSSNGTSDIITCNLPIGTALYTAPPTPGVVLPEVSGLGRDAKHPRALILYLRKEPSDDDIRAIQEALRADR